MLVYVAYLLVLVHVALGALQSEKSLVFPVLLGAGALAIGGAHIAATSKGPRRLADAKAGEGDWVGIGSLSELMESIPESRGTAVDLPGGERVAVFRDGDRLCAMRNACAHQNGPLSEGKVLDGCVTCPWHGYQYEAGSGHSPPPYTEKLPTYELRLNGDRVELNAAARSVDDPASPLSIGGRSDG
jgi:nitrite reductase/ring-hydroxylating ferredoxin subunit